MAAGAAAFSFPHGSPIESIGLVVELGPTGGESFHAAHVASLRIAYGTGSGLWTPNPATAAVYWYFPQIGFSLVRGPTDFIPDRPVVTDFKVSLWWVALWTGCLSGLRVWLGRRSDRPGAAPRRFDRVAAAFGRAVRPWAFAWAALGALLIVPYTAFPKIAGQIATFSVERPRQFGHFNRPVPARWRDLRASLIHVDGRRERDGSPESWTYWRQPVLGWEVSDEPLYGGTLTPTGYRYFLTPTRTLRVSLLWLVALPAAWNAAALAARIIRRRGRDALPTDQCRASE